jgi:Phage portal protein
MASPGAVIAAAKAMPGGGKSTPTQQMPGAPYYGNYSPLTQQIMGNEAGGWAGAYGGFLPRPPLSFTQGAFGPFSPVLPVPVDQPPEGFDRPDPRRFEYEVGWNLPTGTPGSEGMKLAPFSALKTMSELYSVARTCIQLRKSEIRGLDWDIVPTQAATKAYQGDRDAMRDFGERVAKAKKFFRHPDPEFFSFNSWLDAMLEQMLVYDALTLLIRPVWGKGLGKGVLGTDLDSLQLINGATVRPLLDMHGATPRPPAPAYQQYLYGVPRSDYMTMITMRDIDEGGLTNAEYNAYRGDQLLYLPMVKRIDTVYGFPPVERAIIPIMGGLQKQAYQLDFFKEGTVPAVYISPGDPNLTPNQVRDLQDALNAFAGDPAWKHKIIVLPAGSKIDPQKPAEIADQFDEIVMTQVCMAFDVNPMELGIVPRVSTVASPFAAREMAQSQRTTHERVSTKPTLKFLADIFDGVLHRILGQDDMKFVFEGLSQEEQANALTDMLVKQVQYGIRSVDEARDELELPPWGMPETSGPVVFTAQGPMPFGPIMATDGQTSGPQMQNSGQTPPGVATGPQGSAEGKLPPSRGPAPGTPQSSITPGHEVAQAEATEPSVKPGGPARRESPRQRTRKAAEAELEALVRHLRKGRDPMTWEVQHLPDYVPQVIANQVNRGEVIDDVADYVQKMITLDSDDYAWQEANA